MLEDQLKRRINSSGCGEIRRIRDFYFKNWERVDPANRVGCSCGSAVEDCTFWKKVIELSGLDFAKDSVSSTVSGVTRMTFKGLSFFGPKITRAVAKRVSPLKRELKVAENYLRLLEAYAQVSGSPVIVDSSKQGHQFLLLRAAAPITLPPCAPKSTDSHNRA